MGAPSSPALVRRADAKLAVHQLAQGLRLTASDVWTQRRRRAERLCSDHPHASELLGFYAQLVGVQQPIFTKAAKSRWRDAVASAAPGPRIRLDRLPARARERAFGSFIKSLPASATDVLQAIAGRLMGEATAAHRLLETFLAGRAIDEIAVELDCAAPPLEFFPRAFVQPIAEALVTEGRDAGGDGEDGRTACPHCGAPPLATVYCDEPEIKGRRTLLCSLCASEWIFPRSCCPNCGEQQPDRLNYHVSEFWSYVRVEECGSCRTYLKGIDLRENGLAVPVVDELASVELDLWAAEQGMVKLQKNVLGL